MLMHNDASADRDTVCETAYQDAQNLKKEGVAVRDEMQQQGRRTP